MELSVPGTVETYPVLFVQGTAMNTAPVGQNAPTDISTASEGIYTDAGAELVSYRTSGPILKNVIGRNGV